MQLEAACTRLGLPYGDTTAPVLAEAGHWRLLLQTVDARGDGCTVLYWMIRDDDLAARRFDRVWFTKQRWVRTASRHRWLCLSVAAANVDEFGQQSAAGLLEDVGEI